MSKSRLREKYKKANPFTSKQARTLAAMQRSQRKVAPTTSFQLKPGWQNTFFLLLMLGTMTESMAMQVVMSYAHSNDTQSNPNGSPPDTINPFTSVDISLLSHTSRIRSQIWYDPRLSGREVRKCNELVTCISELAASNSVSGEAIALVYASPHFKMKCVADISQDSEHDFITRATLETREGALTVSAKLSSVENKKIVLNHAFLATAWYYLREGVPLYSTLTPEQMASPIHPVTPSQVKAYNDALDKGDERMWEYIRLFRLADQGIVLSEAKNNELWRYINAMNDSIKMFTPRLFRKKPMAHTDHCPIDIMRQLDKTKVFKNSYFRLIKRDASTFQGLTPEAMRVFYPEATEMREAAFKALMEIKEGYEADKRTGQMRF